MQQTSEFSTPELEKLFKSTSPKLGYELKKEQFLIDSEYVNLNNGSYGTCPKPVFTYANYLNEQIESKPDFWYRVKVPPMLDHIRTRIAELIGAEPDECALVSNTSMGMNIVLRNFEWYKEDTIVLTSITYGSIVNVSRYLSDSQPHPSLSIAELNYPITHSELISKYEAHIKSVVSASRGTSGKSSPDSLTAGKGKIVAIIDSIVSNPGVYLPWQEMVRICRENGVWSVVDAAHSIGQEMNIDLGKYKPDFWVSNCHKWLLTKRSCAVLYAPRRNQHILKSAIPTSHDYVPGDPNFVGRFLRNGTIDMVPWLCINAALDFRKWLGGEKVINDYCHDLAIRGGKKMAEIMGTGLLDDTKNYESTLNMVNVYLPLPSKLSSDPLTVELAIKEKLLHQTNAYAACFNHNGRWMVRCSAQVFNEIDDFEKIAHGFVKICGEIAEENKVKEIV